MNKLLIALVFVLAISGSISDKAGEDAYGNDLYDPGQADRVTQDSGITDSVLGFLDGTIGNVFGVFNSIVPAVTGIWFIDEWIINPSFIVLGFEGLNYLRGR